MYILPAKWTEYAMLFRKRLVGTRMATIVFVSLQIDHSYANKTLRKNVYLNDIQPEYMELDTEARNKCEI